MTTKVIENIATLVTEAVTALRAAGYSDEQIAASARVIVDEAFAFLRAKAAGEC